MKFSVHGLFDLPDLSGVLDGGAVRERPRRTLRATYYDTRDLRLARAGVTLRYRTGETGARWHLKLPTSGTGGPTTARDELAVAGPAGEVPAGLRSMVTAVLRSAPLAPVATLRTERRTLDLCGPDGELLAELVDDTVSVIEGRRVVTAFREIEVERREAGDELLTRMAHELEANGAVGGEFVPKVVRALGPRAAVPPDLDPPAALPSGATAGEAVTHAIARSVRKLLDEDLRVRRGAPDAVHQMRVACRRLRSDLRTFRPVVAREWADPLREELRWIAGVLGGPRDLEVQRARLRTTAGADPLAPLDDGAVDRVDGVLTDRERTTVAGLDEALASERYLALLDRLVDAASRPELIGQADERADVVLPALVSAAWRELRRAARKLAPEAEDEIWHEARIVAKRTRYAAEAAVPAVGKAARRFGRACAGVQEVLGEHQDAAVAAELLLDVATEHPDDPALLLTCGRMVERERGAVRASRTAFPAAWAEATRARSTSWLVP